MGAVNWVTHGGAISARRLGLHNIATRVLDLHDIDEPDASYDVVIRREGLMLAPDPAPGLMFDAISAQLEPYTTPDGWSFPRVALLTSAQRG